MKLLAAIIAVIVCQQGCTPPLEQQFEQHTEPTFTTTTILDDHGHTHRTP